MPTLVKTTRTHLSIERAYNACQPYQWARELLQNSAEADATWVEFGIEWEAVEKHGHYRRMVSDNGHGMAPTELVQYFQYINEGSKPMGGKHENFGIGAKISCLPWNHKGMVVISFQQSQASMIWIRLHEDGDNYELREFETDDGLRNVVDPTRISWPANDINWGRVKPDQIKEHGTVVVLLGSDGHPDTIKGDPGAGETNLRGLSHYLNTRYWDIGAKVSVVEMNTVDKSQWPAKRGTLSSTDRTYGRHVHGAKHFIEGKEHPEGKLKASGDVLLSKDRVIASWYIWEGKRPDIHTYAQRYGYVATRYKNELYEITDKAAVFRHFGIDEKAAQKRVTIILEPNKYQLDGDDWGIAVDSSRSHLTFTNSAKGVRNIALPLSDWGLEFSEVMPQEIEALIDEIDAENGGSVEDPDYQKRLRNKFGARFAAPLMVKTDKPNTKTEKATPTVEEIAVHDYPETDIDPPDDIPPTPRPRIKTPTIKVLPGGKDEGVYRKEEVDLPQYKYMPGEDNFEKPWHLAVWMPNSKPKPMVGMNPDSPFLLEQIKHWTKRYPNRYMKEITREIKKVYGEVAVCQVAHVQQLRKHLSAQDLDDTYRNEAALTVGLLGLMAEEAVIGNRLRRFKMKASYRGVTRPKK